jgi:hypothetical protein
VSDAGTATHAADYTQRAGDPTVIRLNAVEVVNAAWQTPFHRMSIENVRPET